MEITNNEVWKRLVIKYEDGELSANSRYQLFLWDYGMLDTPFCHVCFSVYVGLKVQATGYMTCKFCIEQPAEHHELHGQYPTPK